MSTRRFLVPEVVQTSKTDCGPAALKAILEGFGFGVNYSRLREMCHTDVDGTSVDRLEQVANGLGLDAEQVVVPADHVLLHPQVLPGIAVVSSPAGYTHLVVVWRTLGQFVQVMDPARGRMWMSRQAFLRQLHTHTTVVSAHAWRQWAGSDEFVSPLRARLLALGLSRRDAECHIAAATADPSVSLLAGLDASTRLVATLRAAKALRRADSAAALSSFLQTASQRSSAVPEHCWLVRPTVPASDGEPQVILSGAVILRVSRRQQLSVALGAAPVIASDQPTSDTAAEVDGAATSSALRLVKILGDDGIVTSTALAAALAIAVVGMTFETMLLFSVVDLAVILRLPEQRLAAMAALAIFAVAMLGLEWILARAERRLGAQLDARLRIALLEGIRRLGDRYAQSRPMSDMAERSHSVHNLRLLPSLAIRTARIAAELALTAAALTWLAPSVATIAIAGTIVTAAVPLLGYFLIAERDLRHRTHAGALARFHLDALLGRGAIDAHNGGSSLEREHEQLLAEWTKAGVALGRATTLVEGLQTTVGLLCAGWLVTTYVAQSQQAAALLPLVYWSLNLPALGYELALSVREYPYHRSTVLRLQELLEDSHRRREPTPLSARELQANSPSGTDVVLRGVRVVAAGQTILDDITCHLPSCSHIAVVGPSGAGKSTLVGLLLGWHDAAIGEVFVDGRPLRGESLERLRRRTTWVDPTVQIWDRSMLDNLIYGTHGIPPIAEALADAELLPVVAGLESGLGTALGQGGATLSAGEGQRVRLGRALLRPFPSLVLLDEPFRGLEQSRRSALLARMKDRWRDSTVLYVTHDVAEALTFDRVLVIEDGRLVEDGSPSAIAVSSSSRFGGMLQAQTALRARFGAGTEWRRFRCEHGAVQSAESDAAC